MTLIQKLADLFSCKTDTIVTIIITIVIFITGILVNLFLSGLKKSNDRRNFRNFILEQINNVCQYTKKQSIQFEKFQLGLRINNHAPFILTKHTENSLDTLNKLTIERIYDSFLSGLFRNTKKRRKGLRYILNNTQLIESINSGLPEELEKMISKFNAYENNWNKSIEEVRKVYDFFRQQYFSNSLAPEYVPFLNDLNEIFSDLAKSKSPNNRLQFKEKVVDVLPNAIIKKYNYLPIVIELQNSVSDAKLAFDNMENLLNIYADIFSGYKRTYSQYERKMKVGEKMIKRKFCQ